MFSIDKQFRQVESSLADAHDTIERMERELEQVRKKFADANQEKLAAFESLESY
jgi:phage shock protein A